MSQLVVVEFRLPVRFAFQGKVLPKSLAKLEDFSMHELVKPGGNTNNGKVKITNDKVTVQLNRELTRACTGCLVTADELKYLAMDLLTTGDPIPGVHRSLYA